MIKTNPSAAHKSVKGLVLCPESLSSCYSEPAAEYNVDRAFRSERGRMMVTALISKRSLIVCKLMRNDFIQPSSSSCFSRWFKVDVT